MPVLYLVTQADQKLQISSARESIATMVLLQALGEIPVLWLTINLDVSVALRDFAGALVPRISALAV
jgi:hypothetical protein